LSIEAGISVGASAHLNDSAGSRFAVTVKTRIFFLEDWSFHRAVTVAALVYVAISLLVYWPLWPGDPHLMVGCACGDPALQSWFLGYTPWAILHGHNPFFTTYMDYPRGANMASNTLMPLLGVLGYPITAISNAMATFNFLMWLSYPLSALSAFFVVRRLAKSNIAAFYAGLVYGFSPYMLHQGYGHLNLIFVPLPPLIFYFVAKILVLQDGHSLRTGLALGLAIGAQFLISTEVDVTAVIIAVLLALLWSLLNWRLLTRDRVVYVLNALLPGICVAGVLIAYPAFYAIFGSNAVRAPYQNGILNPYRADLIGAIIPNSLQQFAPNSLATIADRLTAGSIFENGSYLGLPMLLAFFIAWIRYFHLRWVRFAGVAALVSWVLSLGPWLVVDTHQTSLRLPFFYLAKLPMIFDLLPARFSLYVAFFVAATVAAGVAAWITDARLRFESGQHASRRQNLTTGLISVCLLASLVAIFPKLPTATGPTSNVTPSFFTSSAADVIPEGSAILTYPYPDPLYSQQAMLWQVATKWRWKMMGAYAQIPGQFANSVTPNPWPTPPLGVVNFLQYWDGYLQGTVNTMPPAVISPILIRQTKDFVHRYQISSVVVDLSSTHSDQAVRLFTDALGQPQLIGGVALWSRLATLTK